jgi:methyl-accepting chemotaxis protein
MEEMASMTRRNAENSQQAAAMMADTEKLVHSANASLDEMVVSMTAIKESSDKVSKIIKTIDEIALQTNILALNAAVEAARAGEAGMGFAVVADEVRSLAQRIDQVAQAITQMEKVTQTTAATAEESAAANEELSAQAETSMTVVGRLAALVGGTARRGRPAAARRDVRALRPAAAGSAKADAVHTATAAKVVKMAAPAVVSPEDEIPLEDTGTYGRF